MTDLRTTLCSRRSLFLASLAAWITKGKRSDAPRDAADTPAASAPAASPKPVVTRTVILVRHAEKDLSKPKSKDPNLSAAGEARAQRLASWLKAQPVHALYATDYRRTQQTLTPLAKQSDLEIKPYSARKSSAFAKALCELDGATEATSAAEDTRDTIVIAGHSNTVPAMVTALGGELANLDKDGWLTEEEYDRVVIVTLSTTTPGEPLRAVSTLDLRMVL